MDPVKEAFAKAKQDVLDLRSEIASLREEITQIKSLLSKNPTNSYVNQTDRQSNTSDKPTNTSLNEPIAPIYDNSQVLTYNSSIGNEGVPTNKQTNQQTNKQSNSASNGNISDKIVLSDAIATFDSLKEQLKLKFGSLTKQEMSVFVAIYMSEEQKKIVDYALIAKHLALSETSIRDYIFKITKKGIPIIKTKQNNKKIILSIDPSLKKIVPLSSLFMLKEPNLIYNNRFTE